MAYKWSRVPKEGRIILVVQEVVKKRAQLDYGSSSHICDILICNWTTTTPELILKLVYVNHVPKRNPTTLYIQ